MRGSIQGRPTLRLALLALAWLIPSGPVAAAEAFSFVVYGDSRSGSDCSGNQVHIGLVNAIAQQNPAFVVNLGDMVTGYTNTTNWLQNGACPGATNKGSLKNIIAPLATHAPSPGLSNYFFPVVGNHDDGWGDDWYPDLYGNGFCNVFDPHTLVPNHTQQPYFGTGVPILTDTQFYSLACSTSDDSVYSNYVYYSFDYKNTHFLVLRINHDDFDLEECGSCGPNKTNYADYYNIHQLDFIKWDLAQARANPAIKDIFVFLHAPLFTTSDDHPANVSWPTLTKEFSKGKVNLVFSGHNHVYERTVPIVVDAAHPGGVKDETAGTVYITSGGGGSPLVGFNAPAWFDANRAETYHYVRVTLDGQSTSVQVTDNGGKVIDAYSRGGPTLTNYTSADTPLPIPDNNAGGVVSTINVPYADTVLDVNVKVNITHTRDSDLVLSLIAPNGTSVLLANHRGGSGANFTATLFDDEAATPIASGTAPFGGSFRPESPLTAADGLNSAGAWKLKVLDSVSSQTGTIGSWALWLTLPACTTPPEVTGDAFAADKKTFSWTSLVPLAGPTTLHQVLRGKLDELPVGDGVAETCLTAGSGLAAASIVDTTVPSAGHGLYYLARGKNACGTGTYGYQSDGAQRTSGVCP